MAINRSAITLLLAVFTICSSQLSLAQNVIRGASIGTVVAYNANTDKLDVTVNSMPVADLARMLSEQTGIEIRLPRRLEDVEPLSVNMRDVNVYRGLEAIFADFNKVINYSDASGPNRQILRIELLSANSYDGETITYEEPSAVAGSVSNEVAARRGELGEQIARAKEVNDEESRAFLTDLLLDDRDPSIRSSAAGAMAETGDPRFGPALARSVGEERESSVRYQVIRALGALDDDQWQQLLVDIIIGDADSTARRIAILTSPRDNPVIHAAVEAVAEDSDTQVRNAALIRLGRSDEIESGVAPR